MRTEQQSSGGAGRDVSEPLPEMHWPTFFVVGAQKAGTTSVYRHLKAHPQVFLPREKEPRYFTPEHKDSYSLDRYRVLYGDAKGFAAIGDLSPYYLANPGSPARIREVCPDARIIILLRDPVERAYSHYLNIRRYYWDSAKSFPEALQRYENRSAREWGLSQEYVEHGLYYGQVLRYFDTFGKDQVLVLLFEDLVRDPNALLMRIAEHIGIDPGFFVGLDLSEIPNPFHMPKGRVVYWLQTLGLTGWLIHWFPRSFRRAIRPVFFELRKPPLDDKSRRWLQKFYEPDIARLEELLGRKLPELRKSWI